MYICIQLCFQRTGEKHCSWGSELTSRNTYCLPGHSFLCGLHVARQTSSSFTTKLYLQSINHSVVYLINSIYIFLASCWVLHQVIYQWCSSSIYIFKQRYKTTLMADIKNSYFPTIIVRHTRHIRYYLSKCVKASCYIALYWSIDFFML